MRLALIFAMLMVTKFTMACDVCSMYLLINPNDYKHSLQLNYRYRSAKAIVKQGFLNQQMHIGSGYFPEDTYVEEYFRTYDLWGNFFLNDKLRLAINLPYNSAANYFNDSLIQEASGIGDISGMLMYRVHNTKAGTNNKFRQLLDIGGGLKLPTGNYKMIVDNEPIQQEYQPGSGSIDFVLNTQYMMRFGQIGLTVNALYQINGENNMGYAFANGFNGVTTLFYQFRINESFVLMPEAGLFYEHAERDTENGVPVFGTGGSSSFLQFGTRTFLGDFAFTGYYFYPVSEELNDFQLADEPRVVIGIQYTFNSKSVN